MQTYSRLRTELQRLREAAEAADEQPGCYALYDVGFLRSLPEEEQESYLQGLIDEQMAEPESSRLRLRSRQKRQADEGAVVLMPIKGSADRLSEADKEPKDHDKHQGID
jgi:hypothetical protein